MNLISIVTLTLAVVATEGAFSPGDTPEVAAAKVAHLAQYMREVARGAAPAVSAVYPPALVRAPFASPLSYAMVPAPTQDPAFRYYPGPPVLQARVPEVVASRMALSRDLARASAISNAMALSASSTEAGYPYFDFYKSLADYYTSTIDPVHPSAYIAPAVRAPQRYVYP